MAKNVALETIPCVCTRKSATQDWCQDLTPARIWSRPGKKLPNRLPACVIGVTLSWLASRRAPRRSERDATEAILEVAPEVNTDLECGYPDER